MRSTFRAAALAAAFMLAGATTQAEAQIQRSFLNLGFEEPQTCGDWVWLVSDSVPGWETTHPPGGGHCGSGNGPLIELQQSGRHGFPARSGGQYAELNANANASRIYQSVCLLPGDDIHWRFSHRGYSGTDVMEFKLGDGNSNQVVRVGTGNSGTGGIEECFVEGNISQNECHANPGPNGWYDYDGTLVWSGAAGTQQIGFEAISTADGNADLGNFLDDIQLTMHPVIELESDRSGVEHEPDAALPQLLVSGNVIAPLQVEVSVEVGGGTATLGDDFTTPSGTEDFTVVIDPGVYAGDRIPLGMQIIDDALDEEFETIVIHLVERPNDYLLFSTQTCGDGARTTSVYTILDEHLELRKSARLIDTDGNDEADAGETIEYTFEVENAGGVELTNVSFTDPLLTIPNTFASLASGAVETFSLTYTLTQADIDSGRLENQATAHAQASSGTLTDLSDDPNEAADVDSEGDGEPDDPTVVVFAQDIAADFLKEATLNGDGDGFADVGETIDYAFTIENTGNVTLSNLTVSDDRATVQGGPLASLAPGATDSTTFSASYTVTQADIDAGEVVNQATATAVSPRGTRVAALSDDPADPTDQDQDGDHYPDDPTRLVLDQQPELDLVKTVELADTNDNGYADVGETLTYAFTVTNTGNVTLTGITIDDDKADVSGGPLASLEAQERDETTFTATYTITPADIDRGHFENTATVHGTAPDGTTVMADSHGEGGTGPTVIAFQQKPAVRLEMTGAFDDADDDGLAEAGETVAYTVTVYNEGNVTLTNVDVAGVAAPDPGVPASILTLAVDGSPLASLPADETATLSATHTLTQADIDAGLALAQVRAGGGAPDGSTVEDLSDDPGEAADVDLNGDDIPDDPVAVDLPRKGALSTVKGGVFEDVDGNGAADPGDRLLYTVTVTNTGNVTLHDVAPHDEGPRFDGKPGTGTLSAFTPGPVTLAPKDTQDFTAAYTLTQADIDHAVGVRNGVTNTATATGTTPDGEKITSPPSEPAPGTSGGLSLPGAAITKVAALTEIRRGERVPYTITVASTTDDPVTGRVIDIMPAGFSYVEGTARLDGRAVEPAVEGRTLSFTGLTITDQETVITLSLMPSGAAQPGKYVNRARVVGADGRLLSKEARAEVEIVPEPVFDCGDLIGKVFDDLNRNGYQDAGEPGLPGVRVTTVKGLRITTDKHGRFHVACADLPDQRIGSTFIMKLDPRTLPTGYRLTTENPRTVRLTAGKASRLNFGAAIGRVVRLDLSDAAFLPGTVELKPEWHGQLLTLIDLLEAEPSVLRLAYIDAAADSRLARDRTRTVRRALTELWKTTPA
ncbi:hypothetical protein [Chelativorans sp. M5D2P16]|uniref:DUF7507 domain-containing protein n=2 Tax=Chelativorans sp. M5D2P16 TaxID=3095678 RepID=UPI002ACA46CF|nr:hypothetical protein [Chelativorans sp. M5D2P16]MDZ5698326.1 hypothetical protein [Chelativorans sp. M5D2P16]